VEGTHVYRLNEDEKMRTIDLAPLYRATVGFDQIADMMDRVFTNDVGKQSYPPYNIEKTDDDAWRISVAVAGFSDDELSVEVRDGALSITARKNEEAEDGRVYLHRGIATRAFERRFHLAEHVRVTGAAHTDGMLHIKLVREVPEALKPRQIKIASDMPVQGKVVEDMDSKAKKPN
jgi:molecular chaperone IbpA